MSEDDEVEERKCEGCGRKLRSNSVGEKCFKCGYGSFGIGCRTFLAHRVAYELAIGPIPRGLTIDHLCRNRWCVEPRHLEPVTLAENVRRERAALLAEAAA